MTRPSHGVARWLAAEGRAAAGLTQLRRRYGRLTPEVYRRRMQQALARRGFNWDTIRELLNHQDYAVLTRYVAMADPQRKAAAAMLR